MATNISQNFIQIVVPYKSNGTGPSQVIDNIVETAAGEDSLQEYNLGKIVDNTFTPRRDILKTKQVGSLAIGFLGAELATMSSLNFILQPGIDSAGNTALSNMTSNIISYSNTVASRTSSAISTGILGGVALHNLGFSRNITNFGGLAIGVASAAISAVLDFQARTAQKNTELQQQAIEAIKRANRAGVISSKRGRAPSSEYKM